MCPITEWICDWTTKSRSGTAQRPTLAKWWGGGAYVQQCNVLSSSPLRAELQEVLGPLTCMAVGEPIFQHLESKLWPAPSRKGKCSDGMRMALAGASPHNGLLLPSVLLLRPFGTILVPSKVANGKNYGLYS